MAIISSYEYASFDESDPDDFRPDSRSALLVDPGGTSETHVDDITLIVEEIAPGDRIPLHTHPINEVIVILEGDPEITLGDETRTLGPGGVVFIPAGTPHRTRNATTSPVRVHAMFPSERQSRAGHRGRSAPARRRDRRTAAEHIAAHGAEPKAPPAAGLSVATTKRGCRRCD